MIVLRLQLNCTVLYFQENDAFSFFSSDMNFKCISKNFLMASNDLKRKMIKSTAQHIFLTGSIRETFIL